MKQNLNTNQIMYQKQTLSSQMLQSLKTLAMPLPELFEYISSQVNENPALEIVNSPRKRNEVKKIQKKHMPYASDVSGDEFQAFIESIPDERKSLQQDLLEQISFQKLDENVFELACKLIQSLDENGFFSEPPELIFSSRFTRYATLSYTQRQLLEKSLKEIRKLEPIGIGWNNIQESLIFQAENRKNPPALALLLLRRYFNLLETPRISFLQKKIFEYTGENFSSKQFEQALDFIESLNPYPASMYSTENESQAFVDIIVSKKIQGDNVFWQIEIDEDILPSIHISKDFEDMARNSNATSSEKSFAAERVKSANNFLNELDQRKKTLINITKALIHFQNDFFLYGDKNLKPLRLVDVADYVDLHFSTISRVANTKFIQCEWGIFPLKFFFTSSITPKNVDKNDVKSEFSKETVKNLIKEIIEESEEKLSDSKIEKILQGKGIKIARRTITKYRSELNINSSFSRK